MPDNMTDIQKVWEQVKIGSLVLVTVYDGSSAYEIMLQVTEELNPVTEKCFFTQETKTVRKFRGRIDEECYLEFKLTQVKAIGRIEPFDIPPFITHTEAITKFWKTLPTEVKNE